MLATHLCISSAEQSFAYILKLDQEPGKKLAPGIHAQFIQKVLEKPMPTER